MTFDAFKTLAVCGLIALGFAVFSPSAKAQTTVQTSITTSSAITVTDGDDIDFGTWFLVHGGLPADDFTLVMDTTGAITDNIVAQDATAIELTAANQNGTVDVTTPLGADNVVLQMTRGAINDFADAGLSLTAVTYATATEAEAPLLLAAVPVTVLVGGTDEEVAFGATITVTGTPVDNTHTATFSVTFAY